MSNIHPIDTQRHINFLFHGLEDNEKLLDATKETIKDCIEERTRLIGMLAVLGYENPLGLGIERDGGDVA